MLNLILTFNPSFPHYFLVRENDQVYIERALVHFDALITSRDLCHFNCKRNENCPTGECVQSIYI